MYDDESRKYVPGTSKAHVTEVSGAELATWGNVDGQRNYKHMTFCSASLFLSYVHMSVESILKHMKCFSHYDQNLMGIFPLYQFLRVLLRFVWFCTWMRECAVSSLMSYTIFGISSICISTYLYQSLTLKNEIHSCYETGQKYFAANLQNLNMYSLQGCSA